MSTCRVHFSPKFLCFVPSNALNSPCMEVNTRLQKSPRRYGSEGIFSLSIDQSLYPVQHIEPSLYGNKHELRETSPETWLRRYFFRVKRRGSKYISSVLSTIFCQVLKLQGRLLSRIRTINNAFFHEVARIACPTTRLTGRESNKRGRDWHSRQKMLREADVVATKKAKAGSRDAAVERILLALLVSTFRRTTPCREVWYIEATLASCVETKY